MKAVSLLSVFIFAKVLVLTGRDISFSIWTPFVYLWQDLLVVLVFAGLNWTFRSWSWLGWTVYGILSLYTAVNVPVACVLSTPLTWPILRAAGGPLADSILYYATWTNLLRLALVLGTAIALPLILKRWRIKISTPTRFATASAAVVFLLVGVAGSERTATLGLHRNPLLALVTTSLPRIHAADWAGDWRTSPFGSIAGQDLSWLRGRAAGRNVVVIHLESTGARYLRPYGAAKDPMPHLTELARQGILFENAYTTYPETIRSFFAVQCSTFPALDTKAQDYEQLSTPGLAQILAEAGYHTGLFHSGRFMYLGMESVIRNRGYQTLEDAGDIGGERESSFGIDEPSTVRRILNWIDSIPPDRPFLVTYLPIAGHHPYSARGPFPDDGEINRYRNALHEADEALGQLVDGLRQRGLFENTLFVIFGDHGEAFGQHAGNYGHTLFIYDENLRVPYIVAAPGLIRDPVRIKRIASLIDTAPTILELLGLTVPSEYQGRSLLQNRPGMALFCTDYSLGFLGLRDSRWKVIHEIESGRSQLFDLEKDPDERSDLADQNRERLAVYRDHLLRWSAAQKFLITRSREN
jgi:glucan phosphoethanolaminetransferase (alkaline phosphatase superfamily)